MKILLVEDDPLWQYKISLMLNELSYTDIHICENLLKTNLFLEEYKPDLIITDIILPDGIIFDLNKELNFHLYPVLFITQSESIEYYNYSKSFTNCHFIVKPFHPISIRSAIDKLLKLRYDSKEHSVAEIIVRGIYGEKIPLNLASIVFVKSELNYCHIKTPQSLFTLKTSLAAIQSKLGSDLLQIHKSYLVNKKFIQKINLTQKSVFTVSGMLPIGRNYKDSVIEYMNQVRKI